MKTSEYIKQYAEEDAKSAIEGFNKRKKKSAAISDVSVSKIADDRYEAVATATVDDNDFNLTWNYTIDNDGIAHHRAGIDQSTDLFHCDVHDIADIVFCHYRSFLSCFPISSGYRNALLPSLLYPCLLSISLNFCFIIMASIFAAAKAANQSLNLNLPSKAIFDSFELKSLVTETLVLLLLNLRCV